MFANLTTPIVRFAGASPNLAFAAGATALAAPLFLSNEERGYLRTAVVTTPVILAGAMAAPHLWDTASRFTRGVSSFVSQHPWSMGYQELRDFLASGKVDLSHGPTSELYNQMLNRRSADIFAGARAAEVPVSSSDVQSIYNRLASMTGKESLVENAVLEAYSSTASPTRLASPIPSASEIIQSYQEPGFLRRVMGNLRQAERLKDRGAFLSPLPNLADAITPVPFEEAAAQLNEFRPQIYETIRKSNLRRHTQIIAERMTDGSIGRLLGVHLKTGELDFKFPLMNLSTGEVRLGEDFLGVGAGRYVHRPNAAGTLDILPIDEWVASNLYRSSGVDLKYLHQDLRRAVYSGVDPLDQQKLASAVDQAQGMFPSHAIYQRSRAAIPTTAPLYPGGRAFEDLDVQERIAYSRVAKRSSLIKIGSEHGLGAGIYEFQELASMTPGGLPIQSMQDPLYRSFTKGVHLGLVPESLQHQGYVTSKMLDVMQGQPPMAGVRLAGVSAQEKTLFGDLPASVEDLYRSSVVERATETLGKLYPGRSPEDLRSIYYDVAGRFLGQQANLSAVRRLGVLGEGDVLFDPKFRQLQIESRMPMTVHQLHMPVGTEFGSDEVIGFYNRQPVTSPVGGTIESAAVASGEIRLSVRRDLPFGRGSKHDLFAIGHKGLDTTLGPETFDRIRDVLNALPERPVIPDFVDALSVTAYTQAKMDRGNPLKVMLDQALDVANRITESTTRPVGTIADQIRRSSLNPEALQEVHRYMRYLSRYGIARAGQNLVENSSILESLSQEQLGKRAMRIARRTEQFFERMTPATRHFQDDPLFRSYWETRGRMTQPPGLLPYMQQTALSTPMAAWDHTLLDRPRQVAVTWDWLSEMHHLGHTEGMLSILENARFAGGDPRLTRDLVSHMLGMNFSRPLGTAIDLREAFGGSGLGSLEGRSGTIFDPTRADLQDNFSIKLDKRYSTLMSNGRQVDVDYLPVLGKKALFGGTNRYPEGQFGATELERSLDVVRRAQGDEALMSKALSDYFETLRNTVFGKEGMLRTKPLSRTGVAGFLLTRPNLENPFMAAISPELVRSIPDQEMREALFSGERVFASAARHPIQSAPYLEMRVDATLSPNTIGIDERIRSMFGSDNDKDTLNLIFHRRHSRANEEAVRAIDVADSMQNRRLKWINDLWGAGEDARTIPIADEKIPDLMSAVKKLGDVEEQARVLERRFASTTVGAYSNLRDRLMINLHMHPTLRHNSQAQLNLLDLFWPIRQVPILAAKNKVDLGPDPMSLYHELSSSLSNRSEEGVQGFQRAMERVAGSFRKGKYGEFVRSSETQSLLREFVMGRDRAADDVARLLTKESGALGESAWSLYARVSEGGGVPFLRGMVGETGGARGAVSEALGSINRSIRAAGAEARRAFRPAGKVLGAGLLAAAALGMLTTSLTQEPEIAVPSFATGVSMSRYRPEQVQGVTDHVPGESVPGLYSSRPPRHELPPPAQTRTAMVARMNRHQDLEVQAKSPDRNASIETQRILSRVLGREGNSSVTVNYVGGWRSRESRLRRRERIREELDRA